jgi:hypothetical protein
MSIKISDSDDEMIIVETKTTSIDPFVFSYNVVDFSEQREIFLLCGVTKSLRKQIHERFDKGDSNVFGFGTDFELNSEFLSTYKKYMNSWHISKNQCMSVKCIIKHHKWLYMDQVYDRMDVALCTKIEFLIKSDNKFKKRR